MIVKHRKQCEVYSGISSGKSSEQCIVLGAEIHFNFQTTHHHQQFSILHAVVVQPIVSIILVTITRNATSTLSIVACKPFYKILFKMIDTINFSKYTFVLKFTCSTKNPTP